MSSKPRRSLTGKDPHATKVLRRLRAAYPDARCALNHRNPLELLIATILSAQCTDERVNMVTRELFRKFKQPQDYLEVSREVLEQEIRSTGFYRNKARSIQGACRMLVADFAGEVPQTLDELVRLPGVARKTANVVLGVAFAKAEGVVVDTHVFRIARRLNLSRATSPEKVELDLMQKIPKRNWISAAHQFIIHGRRVCNARKPLCPTCPVEPLCESPDKMVGLRG